MPSTVWKWSQLGSHCCLRVCSDIMAMTITRCLQYLIWMIRKVFHGTAGETDFVEEVKVRMEPQQNLQNQKASCSTSRPSAMQRPLQTLKHPPHRQAGLSPGV
nr:uncharacterized protein LOC112426256 [Macaca nemestrina]